jgi:hypothetical protein
LEVYGMRFYESKQSSTSPIRYRLEFSLAELEKAKKEIMALIEAMKNPKE